MCVTKEAIEEVRRRNSLVEVVRSSGIQLEARGREYVGRCPFHRDDALSLVIRPDEGRWMCVGACAGERGAGGGDVVAFVEKRNEVCPAEALRRLDYREPVPSGAARWTPGMRRDDLKLILRVAEHYHRTFRECPIGQDYLGSQGLTDPEVLRAFRVGYVDGSLARMLNAGTRRDLRDLGLISQRGREVLEGHVVFPLTTPDIGIVALYGRHAKTGGDRCAGAGSATIFHWQAMKGSTEVVLSGSILDAMTLYQVGIRNVIAAPDTSALDRSQLELLSRFRVRRVLICLGQSDSKGGQTEAMATALHKVGIETVDAGLPDGENPSALLRVLGKERAAEILRGHFRGQRRPVGCVTTAIEDTARPGMPDAPAGTVVSEGDASRPGAPGSAGMPAVAKPEVSPAEGGGFLIRFPARSYRVRGLKEHNLHQLRVNVRVDGNDRMYVETLDLYGQRSRSGWIREAGRELVVPEDELTLELHALIETLEGLRLTLRKAPEAPKTEIADRDREAALWALRDPSLLENILADFEGVGFVGERGALSVGYLAAVSRLLEEPLGIFVTSRSGAGKTSLQEAVCGFVPPESVVRYTQITEQALFYKGEESLVHKVLAVDEERGAADASYSLRILQSAQRLTIAATRSDPQSGRLVTQEYSVRGPVAIFLTTASPNVLDPETRSRFVQVSIDESPEQTRRILERQRAMETLDGLVRRREAEAIRRKHHNMQRLLRPLAVANPFAPLLSYPDDRLQMRREQKKYLTLIKAIALLHQHQRDVKRHRVGDQVIEYVEVEQRDVTRANRLAREVLRHGLDDLAPHTRDLLRQLVRMAASGASCFTREDVRRRTGWSYWSVREHLAHLVKMEYVVVRSGGNGKRMTYQLLFEGDPDEGSGFLNGLVDVEGRGPSCGTLRAGDHKPQAQPAQGVPDGDRAPCGPARGVAPDEGRS